MSNHLARFVVRMSLLREALKLPQDAVIRRVYTPNDTSYFVPHFEVVVEHPDLPTVAEGNMIPLACPEIDTEYVPVLRFKSWGIGGK